MLARANRLVSADDYRNTVRRGRRSASGHTVVYVVHKAEASGSRFGFIVSKAVGNAVTRNLIRRRLKSVCRELVPAASPTADVVIRALPGVDQADWVDLRQELTDVMLKTGIIVKGER